RERMRIFKHKSRGRRCSSSRRATSSIPISYRTRGSIRRKCILPRSLRCVQGFRRTIRRTATIAFFGLRSFRRWKREKIEEKRIDAAINVLAIAYEVKFVFDTIRARYIRAEEYAEPTACSAC